MMTSNRNMNQEELWRKLKALPPEAQRLVVELIDLLRDRYTPAQSSEEYERSDLTKEPFVGMWRDRSNMQDSSEWVRNTRKNEWKESRE